MVDKVYAKGVPVTNPEWCLKYGIHELPEGSYDTKTQYFDRFFVRFTADKFLSMAKLPSEKNFRKILAEDLLDYTTAITGMTEELHSFQRIAHVLIGALTPINRGRIRRTKFSKERQRLIYVLAPDEAATSAPSFTGQVNAAIPNVNKSYYEQASA